LHCDSPASDTARYCENCGSVLQNGSQEGQLAQAYLHELSGSFDAAVDIYEALVAEGMNEPDASAVRKHLGNLHLRLGHLRRARAHLTAVARRNPANATIWHELGVIAYHMAEFDEAASCFRRALEQDAELQLAYFWLGNALYNRGDFDEACDTFRALVDRYPRFTIARFHLGMIHAHQGEREKAEEEFGRALLKNPADVAARFCVGKNGQVVGG
jgi:tetratricopeptide (TPR) repeat protein